MRAVVLVFLVALLLLPLVARCDCDCSPDDDGRDKKKARPLKIAAIFSILLCSAIGVCLPSLGKWVPSLRPENDIFFVIKAFAAGVILATGFIHILPDAFDQLTSPCLSEKPWQDFPFAGFTAMVAAMATLMIDTLATGYFKRLNSAGELAAKGADMEDGAVGANAVRVHAHATHGHAHGVVASEDDAYGQLIRHRVIAQVLELGIIVHSVIIGISLGAMEKPSAIRPLVVALCFHQFFEGIGLGGCIAQASLKLKSTVIMAIFFSCTTPAGIAVGMGISSVYNENSPTALIVEGLLDSAAGGILIYMALVDLLAEDFMNPRVQSKGMLQLGINISLLMGSGLMSLLAKWA